MLTVNNNQRIDEIYCNGKEISVLLYNGSVVWTKQAYLEISTNNITLPPDGDAVEHLSITSNTTWTVT